MSGGDATSATSGSISFPVFAYPSNIAFVMNEPNSHKQVVTLYNPYEFPLVYKVLSTAPRKYSVIEPEGTLRPKCCIDIVVRHLAASVQTSVGRVDKFRIQVQKYSERDVISFKDIPSTVYQRRADMDASNSIGDALHFEGMPRVGRSPSMTSVASPQQYAFAGQQQHQQRRDNDQHSILYLAIIACIGCIVVLSLPLHCVCDPSQKSALPEYLHMTVHVKLVTTFILAMAIIPIITRLR